MKLIPTHRGVTQGKKDSVKRSLLKRTESHFERRMRHWGETPPSLPAKFLETPQGNVCPLEKLRLCRQKEKNSVVRAKKNNLADVRSRI